MSRISALENDGAERKEKSVVIVKGAGKLGDVRGGPARPSEAGTRLWPGPFVPEIDDISGGGSVRMRNGAEDSTPGEDEY